MALLELPLASPVILSGIRIATVLTLGIAAVASYVGGKLMTPTEIR